jgi:hypothetical protein
MRRSDQSELPLAVAAPVAQSEVLVHSTSGAVVAPVNHDLRILTPLAAKLVLYSIPESVSPESMKELRLFSSDRGAVHFLLERYIDRNDLDDLMLYHWDSRIDEDSFRIEETFAAVLITLALSVLANVIYGVSAKVLDELRPLVNSNFLNSLGLRRENSTDHAVSLYNLLCFRKYIYGNQDIDDRIEFHNLLRFLRAGGTLKSYLDGSRLIKEQNIPGLENMEIVAQGLVERITDHNTANISGRWKKMLNGISLTDNICFGEIINCHYPEFIGVDEIERRLDKPALYTHAWDSANKYPAFKPKVLFLNDELNSDVVRGLTTLQISHIVGFVSNRGGFTSHTAVFARANRKAAISVSLDFNVDLKYEFCGISQDKLFLNDVLPTFLGSDLQRILQYHAINYQPYV